MNTQYKHKHRNIKYDRIDFSLPKGMKSVVKILAKNKNMSINAYLIDLIRKDQEGMFDTMQIAEKNREKISAIDGNMHDGYNVIFNDGHTVHCRTKKDVREAIISYLSDCRKCLT